MDIGKIAVNIDMVNLRCGRAVSWLTLAMVILMFGNVVSRYLFNVNLIWQQELVIALHAVIFLSTAGYTLLDDKHVRVDVLYHNFTEKRKAVVNLVATVIFLFPICFAISYYSYDFITSSWQILEGSPEYNGIKGIFLLKTFIWVFSASLFLQGISTILKSSITLRRC